ncbi:MAG: hypothetical protein LAO77_11490, partial [Acidobacteriia bacterium]|nr:hypothetical protein [Terriglobia bacterium]
VARRVRAPFLGTTVLVPEDVQALVSQRYGQSFARPRRGDKGTGRPYSWWYAIVEDLQDNVLGIWSWLRAVGLPE